MIKNYLKCYSLYFILLFCYLIIMSIFYYFNIINYKTMNILNYLLNLVLFFILGYKISSLEKKRGYLHGFLISSLLVILFSIICLILSKFSFSSLVYYLSLIISSMIAGIIGVSKTT